MADLIHGDFVVVGGGIAAVSCVDRLVLEVPSTSRIVVVSTGSVVKAVSNWVGRGRALERFDVETKNAQDAFKEHENVLLVQATVTGWDFTQKPFIQPFNHLQTLATDVGSVVHYDRLCICTGGTPNIPPMPVDRPEVIGIRDTETVKSLQQKLCRAQRLLIIGNGGIATELVHEVEGVDVIWAVRHSSISATFFDAGAGEFFLPHLYQDKQQEESVSRRIKYHQIGDESGSALGPDWAEHFSLKGVKASSTSHSGGSSCSASTSSAAKGTIHVVYNVECKQFMDYSEFSNDFVAHDPSKQSAYEHTAAKLPAGFKEENSVSNPIRLLNPVAQNDGNSEHWPVYVKLTNGHVYGCDVVVCATGVSPAVKVPWKACAGDALRLSPSDGGIAVDTGFRTSVTDVYAAGDVCTADWEWPPHWIQMRLWTQARQMGTMAAISMAMESRSEGPLTQLDVAFDIFTHSTTFFGFKVVLLGRWNSQNKSDDHEALLRVKKGEEYVKVLIENGRVQGAILIGETDLEETLENLILDQVDVSNIKDDMLNSDIDIEDYFD